MIIVCQEGLTQTNGRVMLIVSLSEPCAVLMLLPTTIHFRWRSTPSGRCSSHCGSGEQQQQNTCVRSYTPSKSDESADEQECLAAGLSRPLDRIPCFTDCFGRKWDYTAWSSCSSSCGTNGVIRRQAFCIDRANRRLDERHCEQVIKEAIESECNRIPCPKWSYTQWSEVGV